ncbi:uncharacterized protein RHOBADRAFT_54741 [Rhodotorula graminis WP1]|uniref:Uncharacterized protein n=1 Tax=Rhodotorula graminis (strain WP1) TaxID=578459 RepID=A0A0N8PZX3_RHOGW|nr:uncharacterized protein RHOBADRAFT_54741 [Rhodotorula graminis WP1]KPV73525.1 hypothetical protein RHOBADRAFT_54741 [Rhodotorula graminis WP1]
MQQPYPPRLQIDSPRFLASSSTMFGSPGGAMFASPAAYSGHPFGAAGMLSPEALPHGSVSGPSTHGAAAPASPRSFLSSSAPPPRGHGKRESVSVSALRVGDDPLRSPTLSRATSASPATSSRRDEPRRKKVVVCIPRERSTGDNDDADGEGTVSRVEERASATRRVPLSAKERGEVLARVEAVDGGAVVASRPQHEDEVKQSELPPMIDVYLPGKDAWEEVWDQFEEGNRRPAFLSSPAPPSPDTLFPRRAGHGRTASLFASPSAHLPPRLQSVVDSVRRVGGGHAPTLSLSLPTSLATLRTTPLATMRSSAFPSPSPTSTSTSPVPALGGNATSSRGLTPLADSFVPSAAATRLRAAASTALPCSPSSSPERARLVVAVPHDEQGDERLVAHGPSRPLTEANVSGALVDVDERLDLEGDVAQRPDAHDVVELGAERTHDGRRRTARSRSASGVSTRTDHTGVASLSGSAPSWTNASEEEDKTSSCGRAGRGHAPALSHELSRALTDLGSLDAHEPDEAPRPVAARTASEPAAVEIGASDNSQDGDGELSASEYGKLSDAGAADERAARRARPTRQHPSTASTTDDEDDKPLAMLALRPPPSPLFQAPTEVDRTDHEDSSVKPPQHKVNLAFAFPPRSSSDSPGKVRRQAAEVALPDSSPASSAQASPQLGSFDFVDSAPHSVGGLSFRRRKSAAPSSSSSVEIAFGPFGEPGSLAVSPSALPETPPVPHGDRPATDGASRTSTSSTSSTRPALKATAADFQPSLPTGLPTSFGISSASSFDFLPPADAPILPSSASMPPLPAPTRHVSGSRGPLPPIPLTTVTPHSSALKRRKGDDGDWLPAIEPSSSQHLVSTPLLAHPQPRRPLPDPPSAFEYDDPSLERDAGDVEILREEGDEAEDQEDSGSRSFMSSLSVDDPLPEQYAPARPIGAKRPVARDASTSRPFSLRAAPSLSADGRVLGFRRGGPSPGASAVAPEAQVSPARMGDPRAAREDSVDIALPSSLRAKSKAIPLGAARLKASDIFDGTFGGPDSPASSLVFNGSSSSVVADEEDDDLPLRILEDLISSHFDELKTELVAAREQTRPDLDRLVDSVTSRLEAVLVAQGSSRVGAFEADRRLDEAHKRIEQLAATALERVENAEPSGRPRRPTLLDANRSLSAPPLRPSTPGLVDVGGPALAYSAFLDDLERIVQPLVHAPLDPAVLAASVASAMQPHLADLVERVAPSTSSSQVTVAEPVAFGKVNGDSIDQGLVDAIVTALETRITRSGARKDLDAQLEQTEAGLAVPSHLDFLQAALQAVKAGQEQLVEALKVRESPSATSATGDQVERVVEQILKAVGPSSTSADKARFSDLGIQLAKARNEHGKARSEKAAFQDRLEEDRARHAAELGKLHARLEAQEMALKRVEGEKEAAREALARSQGEVAGLEKRVAAQDARVDALQRAKMVQQQSLAVANQRNSNKAASLAAARARVAELEAASSSADAQVNALDEANTAYRVQLASIQKSLESLQVAVKSEHDEAALRIAQLTTERDRLAEENDRLVRAAYKGDEDAPPTPRQVVGPRLYPTPPSPPSLDSGLALVEQHTGNSDESDETVAHTEFSPTPSVSGHSVVQDGEDGWWTAVDA